MNSTLSVGWATNDLHQTKGKRVSLFRMGHVIALERGVDPKRTFKKLPCADLWFSLAYVEMRIVLAKLLWHFDAELHDDSRSWAQGQKTNMFWEKNAMNVKLTPVRPKKS